MAFTCVDYNINKGIDSEKKISKKTIYSLSPFDLTADCSVPPSADGIFVSCIINFSGRLDLLSGILHSLAQQVFPREQLEVVLVEDKGGTAEGKKLAEDFGRQLPIVYAPLDKDFGRMGYSRNYGLAHSRGEIVLFLDDDTIIMQEDFLSNLVGAFQNNPDIDAVVPRGNSSYGLIKGEIRFP